jgi:hypothetical protein
LEFSNVGFCGEENWRIRRKTKIKHEYALGGEETIL